MKSLKSFFLFTSLFLLVGCGYGRSLQKAYAIGYEHTFGTVKIKIENHEQEEEFVIYYTISEDDTHTHYFSFTFYLSSIEWIRNSDQFTYSDSLGCEIIFDENGYFEFYTSRIFYISYMNASDEVKSCIENDNYLIELSSGTFYSNPYVH